MAKCFEESHQAYERRDGALAKELSNKGKQHQKRMEELNKQASDWIFAGKDSFPFAKWRSDIWYTSPVSENNKVRSILFSSHFQPA